MFAKIYYMYFSKILSDPFHSFVSPDTPPEYLKRHFFKYSILNIIRKSSSFSRIFPWNPSVIPLGILSTKSPEISTAYLPEIFS